MKAFIPNFLTFLRILGAVSFIFSKPFTISFYLIYAFCGFTDMLDGFLARLFGTQSDFGSKLDSVADLMFYGISLLLMMPYFKANLSVFSWCLVAVVLVVRLASYGCAAFKFKRFASIHTYGNKLTGLAVFSSPFLFEVFGVNNVCFVVCCIAFLASSEELLLHILNKNYEEGLTQKTIFMYKK